MKALILLLWIPILVSSQNLSPEEITRCNAQARRVTIIRDNWNVPHIYGKTDADAVFGLLYAQCEENFRKVEENNLEMLGRMSEINGKGKIYDDLQMRLIYDTSAAIDDYRRAPAWFRKLLDAAADGVNYFLYKHPEVKPALLTHFEPWFALLRTNGSISATQTGGATRQDMRDLYKTDNGSLSMSNNSGEELAVSNPQPFYEADPTGSNGFAVAPSKTKSKNAIMYINPHVTFYYRTEMHMVSEEGLNAYGGVTWGTFFVFQGFNEHCGWMHTSSYADVADLFTEKVEQKGDSYFYNLDGASHPVKTKPIVIDVVENGKKEQVRFTGYYTGHGPVMGMRNGTWLSLRENNRSLTALMQSWLRTKATGFETFKKVIDLRSNSSDNTVFADDKGNIAYWHGNFIPKRDPKYDYSLPVDGSISTTDWKGLHNLDEMVHVYNPKGGWIENCNSTPFTVAGESSPVKENYPVYMAPDGQNFRAVNAVRLLGAAKDLTIDKMIHEIGYSHYLSAFEILLPPLFAAYDSIAGGTPVKDSVREAVTILRSWDKNSSETSVAAALAIEWAYRMMQKATPPKNEYDVSDGLGQMNSAVVNTSSKEKLAFLEATMADLSQRFGSWKTSWGVVNRYQRTEDGKFDDAKPSLPVGLASSTWGSIPSFATRRANTNKRYGYSGNSFIACVEFGKKLKAKTVITGGQSFDPGSPHFTDQAEMYISGNFKDVLFYKADVLKHAVKTYHPGD